MFWLDIVIWLFAAIGLVAVILCIIALVGVKEVELDLPDMYKGERTRDVIAELDNEVRGQFKREFSAYRGAVTLNQPTLKGRVDMIEQHLGIKVEVTEPVVSKLKVKKVKKV